MIKPFTIEGRKNRRARSNDPTISETPLTKNVSNVLVAKDWIIQSFISSLLIMIFIILYQGTEIYWMLVILWRFFGHLLCTLLSYEFTIVTQELWSKETSKIEKTSRPPSRSVKKHWRHKHSSLETAKPCTSTPIQKVNHIHKNQQAIEMKMRRQQDLVADLRKN